MLLLLGLLTTALGTIGAQAATSTIDVLHVKGVINPVLVDYIKRGIDQAEENNAIAVIIQLDTPGGLDTSMRDIIKNIVSARVPVVVYVSPSGARAASAGVFITVAAHVAVMAPNTAIGAASPVSIGPEGEQQMSETMKDKVVNDAAAYIRSLTEAQGRNIEWAEKSVREADAAPEPDRAGLRAPARRDPLRALRAHGAPARAAGRDAGRTRRQRVEHGAPARKDALRRSELGEAPLPKAGVVRAEQAREPVVWLRIASLNSWDAYQGAVS